MIDFLSSVSIFLGWIFQALAQLGVAMLVVFGIIYLIDKKTLPSACHGDCNQGRNCTCKEKKDGIS